MATAAFTYYEKRRTSATIKTEFYTFRDAVNHAVVTLLTLVGSVKVERPLPLHRTMVSNPLD